jgi:hypothetical protein
MKPFEKWKTEEVELTFGIKLNKKMPLMADWLQFTQPLTDREIEFSEDLRLRLQDFANFWNEEDIKVFFVVPIVDMVRFYHTDKYRTFMESTIQAEALDINNTLQLLRGRVEMLVATGKQDPQKPFFFMNEYKPQIKIASDPQGQLLIAMLTAQAKNNGSNLPIYGLYNIGQNWFFVVLENKEYCVSKQFDSTDPAELKQIINMLQYVKAHIERNV